MPQPRRRSAPKTQPKPATAKQGKASNGQPKASDDDETKGPDLAALARTAPPVDGSLWEKVEWVQSQVGHVEKTGKVQFKTTKYEVMQEHGLLGVLKPFWRQVGLAVVGSIASVEELGESPIQTSGNLATVFWKLDVVNAKTGDQIKRLYACQAIDQGDKAVAKAMTGAHKYALQKFFEVPTESIDDFDRTASEEAPKSSQAPGLVSAELASDLRALAGRAIEEGHLDKNRVQSYMQSTFRKANVEQLSEQEAATLAQWLADEIAKSQTKQAQDASAEAAST